jgi:ribosomal protein S18 acetylase RimI-like enzyme
MDTTANPQKRQTPCFSLRPAQPSDETFLYELYCSTRIDEIAGLGWSAEQQKAFLNLQFNAQRQHYSLAYEGLDHKIVEIDSHPIGRIMIFRSDREFVLVDIALLPGNRGSGIGTSLICSLLAEAKQAGKPLVLHVESRNPAKHLYERVGFKVIEDSGVYLKMEWKAAESFDTEA